VTDLKPEYRVRLLDPLPWPVRLKLACHRRIDLTACWLVERGHEGAAIRLWRTFRMW